MTISVRLMRASAALFTFVTPTPFMSVSRRGEFDDQEPPQLVAINSTWTLLGILYGTEASLATDWAALKAVLETPATYPDGIDLIKDGSPATVVETLTGYKSFKVEVLDAPQTELQWRGEIRFTLKVSGRKLLSYAGGSLPANVSAYEADHTWSYDETGLATETLTGTVEVSSGSAVASARLLGLTPSGNYAFVTNGPEGVDVEQLDRADRKARFTSTIRESGLPLPGNVGPSFTVNKETSVQANGEEVTVVSVQAAGTGAEDAVKAQRPASVFTERVAIDNYRRHASGTFVTKKIITQKTHRFTVTGGGRGTKWTRRTGARPPASHLGSFGEVTIREEFRVEVLGDPAVTAFKVPLSLAGLPSPSNPNTAIREDTSGVELQGPEVIEFGRDRMTTKWAITMRRRYQATSFSQAADAIFRAQIVESATRGQGSGTLDVELAKPDSGSP